MSPRLASVLDVSGELGRAAVRLLVGAGADVVRVQLPEDLRPRSCTEPDPVPELARLHWGAGVAQRVLDPRSPEDWSALEELAADADILVDACTTTPDRSGQRHDPTSYDAILDELAAAHPALVRVSITPYGADGPRSDWRATDLTLAAAGGMMSLSGSPEGPPLVPPRRQAVQVAGADAALGALLGLRVARRTHRGQGVEIAAQESVASALEYGALLWIHERRVHRRAGDRHPQVPHRLFPCRDGWAAGGFGGSPRMWHDLLAWMDEEGAAGQLTDPRWDDEQVRSAERETIFAALADFTRRFDRHAFADEAQRRRLPWSAVDPPSDVLTNPQLRARNFFMTLDGDEGEVTDVGFGFELATRKRPVRLRLNPTTGPAVSTPDRRRPDGLRMDRALDGIRVLDLTWVLAGPYATKILADHGADVVKVESRARPDPTRFASAARLGRHPNPGPDTNGYFNNFNRNKRSITLDLRQSAARETFAKLVAASDVVFENYSAGAMTRLGFGYEELDRIRPGIVLTSMSGMGHTGPWRTYVSYADTLAAAAGLTAETAGNGQPPVGLPFGFGDMVAGLQAVVATLAALELREQTGAGCHIDLSQLEAVVSQLDTAVLEAATGHESVLERDNRHPQMAPHGAFRCAGEDRWCAIAVTDDTEWAALAQLMQMPELADDPRFATLADRKAQEDELEGLIEAWTCRHDRYDLAARLQAAGIPAAVVQDGRDLVEHDEHLQARGFYVPATHPVVGEFLHEGVVARLSDTPGGIRSAAPTLGQHTAEVLREWVGFDDAEIRGLEETGVLS